MIDWCVIDWYVIDCCVIDCCVIDWCMIDWCVMVWCVIDWCAIDWCVIDWSVTDWCVIASFQLTGFQLDDSQTYRTWPQEMDLTAFADISLDVITKLLTCHDGVLKQSLGDLQTDIRLAKQSLVNGVDRLSRCCQTFNDSTAIDETFLT